MVFLLSQLVNGAKSSLHKANKPSSLFLDKVKYLSKPLQNTVGTPIQKAKIQTQESLRTAISLPRLNKIQQAVSKAFGKNQNKPNFPNYLSTTQDAEQYYLNNTRVTKRTSLIEANPYTSVDYRYNSNYSRQTNINQHIIKTFENNNSNNNLNGLLSVFLNSDKSIKLQKTVLASNLDESRKSLSKNLHINAQEVFDMLDPHHVNTTVINNINLIDKDLALNLAQNKQRLIVHNGNDFNVLIPRLEHNKITNNNQVFWHLVNQYNLNPVYSYSQLDEYKKNAYTQSQFKQVWKSARLINQDNLDISKRSIQRLEKQKKSLENNINKLANDFLINHSIDDLVLYNPFQEVKQQLNECNEELKEAHQKYNTLNIRFNTFSSLDSNVDEICKLFSKYAVTYGDEFSKIDKDYLTNEINHKFGNHLSAYQQNLIYGFLSSCSNHFENRISKTSNFSLQDMLSFIKQDNNPLTITASKISKLRHKFYPSLIEPKTSDLAKTYALDLNTSPSSINTAKNFVNNDSNHMIANHNMHLLSAISDILGQNTNDFTNQNPAVARNILEGINKKHGLKDLIHASGEHVDRYDLTSIYKTQDNVDSRKRKNGGSLLQGPIKFAISNKKSMLLELNSKLPNPFAKPSLFSIQYKNNIWQVQDLNSLDIHKITDINSWLARQSKDYAADLYTQRDKEITFSRDVYRCKFKKNISTPSLDLYDKLVKHKAKWEGNRADNAIDNIYKGIQLRNEVAGNYKQNIKPDNNVITRFLNAYINPFSVENSGARKIGKYFRNAAYDHEDSARRYWGFFKGGVGQPQDTLLTHLAVIGGVAADHPAFSDSTVQYAFHQGTDFFAQLCADAVQPLSYHTMAKYGHLFNVGLGKSYKEIRHDINNLQKIITNNLKLLDTVTVDQNKKIHIDGKIIQNREEAQQIIKDKLLESFVALLSLVYQSKAQDKIHIGIAFIDQFFQNLFGRVGYFAMAIFSLGAEQAPGIKKLYRVIRRGIQTPLAGVDNINRQRYLDTTNIYIPRHLMTDKALKYNLDTYVGKLPPKEFENNVIRIMIDNYEIHYTKNDFNNMSQAKRDYIISRFLIDASKVHNNAVSYNIERRMDIIQSYITETYAEHRKLEYQYKQKITELENIAKSRKLSPKELADKKHFESELIFTQKKIAILKEEEVLFYQGVQYNRDINSNPPKNDHINWQFSWGTLQRNYPNGFLAEFLNPKDPMPVVKKKLKLLFKQPNEALMHILFRTSNSAILATDEVSTAVATQVEASAGGLAAQMAVMALMSTTFSGGISAGIVRYFENVSTFGKPRGHATYVCAMIWALDKKLSEINRKMSNISNSENANENEQKFNELLQNAKNLNKIKELLENDIKPNTSLARTLSRNKNVNQQDFTKNIAEFLSTGLSSLIPRKENTKLNGFRTDENKILDIMDIAKKKSANWYQTQSVIYPIAERLKGKFGRDNPNIDPNSDDNLNAFNSIFQEFVAKAQNDANVSYEHMLENLFNKIPNSINKTTSIKIDYALQRREFISKIQLLSKELNNLIQEAIKELEENAGDEFEEYDYTYIHNLQNLQNGLSNFIKSHKDIKVPNGVEYINLNDIKATEQGEIFLNNVKHEQNTDDKLEKSSEHIKIDLASSFMWNNWSNYGGLDTTPNDSTAHKAMTRIKKAGSFTYKYILPVTNPLHRRFLPTMYLQNAITAPVVAWDKIRLIHKIRGATYVGQKALNSDNLQETIDNDLENLSINLQNKNSEITSLVSNPYGYDPNTLARLTNQRENITSQRESLLVNTSQPFRLNDRLPKQLFKIATLGKPTSFEIDTKNFLGLRSYRLTEPLNEYKPNPSIYSI
ncbi:MAG: hypothetical protein RLZZ210_1630 [Pseudomonadota bacterium]